MSGRGLSWINMNYSQFIRYAAGDSEFLNFEVCLQATESPCVSVIILVRDFGLQIFFF